MAKSKLHQAYSTETYERLTKKVTSLLLQNYAQQKNGKNIVSNTISANDLRDKWANKKWDFESLLAEIMDKSIKLHNPNYMGHQVSAPLPMAILFDLVAAHFNNGMAVYEMGQASSVADDLVIKKLASWLKLSENTNGILTNGGTIGNLTALLAAKNYCTSKKPKAIIVSKEAHYSITRAADIMGLDKTQIYFLPTTKDFQSDVAALEKTHENAKENGHHVFAIVANACSTSTGSYDNINALGTYANQHNIWFHVDGAHGGAVGISNKYAFLTAGIQKANSIVIDFHKMLLCPALITAVLYKNTGDSFLPFQQKAAYLLNDQPEWENMAMRTLECTKYMMGVKAYGLMELYGKSIFEEFIDRQYDLTRDCAEIINNHPNFELALEPQSNILCFRYVCENSNKINLTIRQFILENGKYYIVKTEIDGQVYLRCTFMNPYTTTQHFKGLLDFIQSSVKTLEV